MRLKDDVRPVREQDGRDISAELLDFGKFCKKSVRINDRAGPAYRNASGCENAGRHLMESEHAVMPRRRCRSGGQGLEIDARHNRMAGVGATVETQDKPCPSLGGDGIDDLAFAFVSPPETHHDDRAHYQLLPKLGT